MSVGKKVPEIRFEGFSGEWAENKLGGRAEIVRGASPRPIEDPKWFDKNSNVGWLRIRDVTEQDGRIHYLEQRISKLGQERTRVLFEQSLLLSIAASVGKPVINYVETGVHDGFLIFKKPRFELEFMYQWLKSFELEWQQYGQPGSQVNLNSDIVKNQVVFTPCKQEQTQIGNTFQKLDSLINQHQQKHDKLSNIKKAMLEKMFPKQGETVPEIRFKGFSGEWEAKGITDISKVFIGLVTTMTTSYRSKGVLLIRNSDIKSNRFEFSVNPIYLDEKFADEHSSRRLMLGDVVTVHTGDVGTSAVVTEKEEGSIGFATIVSRPNKNIVDSNYLSVFLNTDIHKSFAINVSTGDGRANYNLKDFYKLNVPLPAIDEQAKIGNYFQKLDALINQHQQQITKLNNIKQACLSKMFV
jgi:type I restriction enzyme S subunit